MKRPLILPSILCAFSSLAAAHDGAPVVFHGRVWVVEAGVRRAAHDGSMHLLAEKGWNWRDEYDVSVVDGRFRQIVHPEHESYRLGTVRLEGREALCSWKAERAGLAQSIELEARFLPITRVRVRLQGADEELVSCDLIADHLPELPRAFELPHVVPAWYEPEFGDSWQSRRSIRAHAPGTAWGSAVVDVEAGGDVWIDLAPEAKLRVNVFVPPEIPLQEMRLVGQNGRFDSGWRSLTHDGQVLGFDSLGEGAYAIDTRSRAADVTPLSRRVEFHLCEGETRELLLDLDSLAAEPRTPVRGSLTLDSSWPAPTEPAMLWFLRKDPRTGRHGLELSLEVSAGASGALSWEAGRLRSGRYAVLIDPYGSAREVEVKAGLEPVALEIPPPIAHRLRFVDARTRSPIAVESLSWWPAALCSDSRAGERRAFDLDDGPEVAFEAPRGRLRVVPHAPGYRDTEFLINPLRKNQPQEFALEQDCTLRVRLFDGEQQIPLPSARALRIVHLKGASGLPRRSLVDGGAQIRFEEPGTYAISSDRFDGFAASEPVSVEARLGEVVDVVLLVGRPPAAR